MKAWLLAALCFITGGLSAITYIRFGDPNRSVTRNAAERRLRDLVSRP